MTTMVHQGARVRALRPWHAMVAWVSLAAAGCGGSPSAEPAAARRAALLELAPDADAPGHGALSAMWVGTSADGAFALAVAAGAEGELLAYTCDGATRGAWMFGLSPGAGPTRTLIGEGARLLVTVTPLGELGVLAQLELDGVTRTFALEPAHPYAGMYRFDELDAEGPRTVSWVLLNDNGLVGLDSAGGGLKSRPIAELPNAEDPALGGGPADEEVESEEQLLNRFRCGRLVLRVYRFFTDTGPAIDPNGSPWFREQRALFDSLGCEELGFALTAPG